MAAGLIRDLFKAGFVEKAGSGPIEITANGRRASNPVMLAGKHSRPSVRANQLPGYALTRIEDGEDERVEPEQLALDEVSRRGALARAAKLSPEKRARIARKAARARWKKKRKEKAK